MCDTQSNQHQLETTGNRNETHIIEKWKPSLSRHCGGFYDPFKSPFCTSSCTLIQKPVASPKVKNISYENKINCFDLIEIWTVKWFSSASNKNLRRKMWREMESNCFHTDEKFALSRYDVEKQVLACERAKADTYGRFTVLQSFKHVNSKCTNILFLSLFFSRYIFRLMKMATVEPIISAFQLHFHWICSVYLNCGKILLISLKCK